LYFGGHFGFKMATIAIQRWLSIGNIIIYMETKYCPNRRIFVFGSHFVPWLPWQRPPFWIFYNPQKLPHTTVDIPTKFDGRNQIKSPPPFFVYMATAAKFVQPIPIFFGLSRSTRCRCCSYQVSSISVQRVTCYDHFCVFQFFSILAVSLVW
jgi:hypothetical protein